MDVPDYEPHHAAWPILLAIAIGVGGLAARLVPPEAGDAARRRTRSRRTPTGFERVLYNKWYVDEVYDTRGGAAGAARSRAPSTASWTGA